MRLSDLQLKEIIVIDDGKRLGHISDLELDVNNGRIVSLVILVKDKKSGLFGKMEELEIHWSQIVTIGADVILVRKTKTPQLYLENKYTKY